MVPTIESPQGDHKVDHPASAEEAANITTTASDVIA